jgi:hypothetical protein
VTPKETALSILGGLRLDIQPAIEHMVDGVEQAINAAIDQDRASRECCKAERKACEQIAEGVLRSAWVDIPTAQSILEKIRARSEEKK